MSTAVIIVILLAAAVLAVILGGIAWGIRTQRSDRGITLVRRRRRPPGR